MMFMESLFDEQIISTYYKLGLMSVVLSVIFTKGNSETWEHGYIIEDQRSSQILRQVVNKPRVQPNLSGGKNMDLPNCLLKTLT